MVSKTSWISLSRADTTFVFARNHSIPLDHRWPWIVGCIKHEFDCGDDDEIDTLETDDGRELITLNGEPVAEIHHCALRGYAAGAEPVRSAT